MPDASPSPARGAQPGKFQRPKVRRAGFRRVTMECGEAEPTLWWDRDGRLYEDRELTMPTRLTIVELVE